MTLCRRLFDWFMSSSALRIAGYSSLTTGFLFWIVEIVQVGRTNVVAEGSGLTMMTLGLIALAVDDIRRAHQSPEEQARALARALRDEMNKVT